MNPCCSLLFSLVRWHFHFSTPQFYHTETILSKHLSVAISWYLKASLSVVQLIELNLLGVSSPFIRRQIWSDEGCSQPQSISFYYYFISDTWEINHSVVTWEEFTQQSVNLTIKSAYGSIRNFLPQESQRHRWTNENKCGWTTTDKRRKYIHYFQYLGELAI